MGDGEEYPEQVGISDDGGVVVDADGLGMTADPGTDRLVVGALGTAAGIARRDAGHPGQLGEDRLGAPKAATGQHGDADVLFRG